ncbi:MAG TPA: 50S ribosomal protein L15 [Pirellulales bacterium]|nr:50S ribosomal protein L15 [Pirellulales bacterium]
MNIHDVNRGIKKHKKLKRVGRGPGSGHGKTAGRGHKGQGQLAGWTSHPAFEGGQFPVARRVPKRGFHNKFAQVIKALNLSVLNDSFEAGEEVTLDRLRSAGLVSGRFDELKILGNGELTKKLKITAHRFSESALEKIKKAGGEAVVLPGKAPVVKGQKKDAKKAAQS